MKIAVLNGSPKGPTSVTMQYVHYIRKTFPAHALKVLNISQRLAGMEKDSGAFQRVLDEIKASDGVLWATPVYYLLVPANYKRFIELIWEREVQDVFSGKYTACLTTSIHFFDHTAHNYINAVCDDLGMRWGGSFSAEMYDLLKPREQARLRLFAEHFFRSIETGAHTPATYLPLRPRKFSYVPHGKPVENRIDMGGKKILIVTDVEDHQQNLKAMIHVFRASFNGEVETVNLHDLHIKGSCLGCIRCGYDNRCVYEGQDDYIAFYDQKVRAADILVWAGAVKDRYLSARWKTFFDRSFFKGHAPSLAGKQIGFIISGPLGQIPNLRQVLEAYVEVQQANPAGFVTDEDGDGHDISGLLQDLGERLVRFAREDYIRPPTFLSVGGRKLFRDVIWGWLRFPFRADHVAYKRSNAYDFPQKAYKVRARNAFMLLLSRLPSFRKEVDKKMKAEMIKPLQKVLGD